MSTHRIVNSGRNSTRGARVVIETILCFLCTIARETGHLPVSTRMLTKISPPRRGAELAAGTPFRDCNEYRTVTGYLFSFSHQGIGPRNKTEPWFDISFTELHWVKSGWFLSGKRRNSPPTAEHFDCVEKRAHPRCPSVHLVPSNFFSAIFWRRIFWAPPFYLCLENVPFFWITFL